MRFDTMRHRDECALLSRRSFLAAGSMGLFLQGSIETSSLGQVNAPDSPYFRTRGVVITPEDLSLHDWPERASRAGLTTLALHPTPGLVLDFLRSDPGHRFVERCRSLGIQVEYELHAMSELLPRDLFAKDRNLFRMDDNGERNPDANLCVHSRGALDFAAEKAVGFARRLVPSSKRYFFWGDDGRPWCRCPKCRGLTDSDQSLIFENHLIKALRDLEPQAQLAHLAYANTLSPPVHVKPEPDVFLEYAPIRRRHDQPYAVQTQRGQADPLSALDGNLSVFPADTAQVLEYWLDVSRFSGWRRPAVKLPWRPDVLRADLAAYSSRGIRKITSFAVYVDQDYQRRFGEPAFLQEYGEALSRFRRV